MKIATNTPQSFFDCSEYEFVQLGGDFGGVSLVLLMLEKNWGSNSVEKIKALKHWVSLCPKNIPCYIVGCETTIPSLDVEKFRHLERDKSIRELCDEVLSRSSSIGVRGEITKKYLHKILGYREDQIDILYSKEPGFSNKNALRCFFDKNSLSLSSDLMAAVFSFQERPFVMYERGINSEEKVVISKPWVDVVDKKARLCSEVFVDGQATIIWCEVDAEYSGYLLVERSDAFLCALLPFLMRVGKDVECKSPVTERFLHNLNEILIPQLCSHDKRLYFPKIFASTDSDSLPCGEAVATAMSSGVDSFFTVGLYMSSAYRSMNLTHLYCGNYLYGNSGPIYERAKAVASELGLPLVCSSTNINEVIRVPHLYTHFFKTMFGVLSLRKLFSVYYYSTAEDFSHFQLKGNGTRDTAEFELLLLYSFCCADFQVITGGVKSERLEKTRAISYLGVARKYLNVCLYPSLDKNCGTCEKCRRTLLMLDLIGELDSFRGVFDVDEYRRNRIDSFVYLVKQRKSIMLSEVYRLFAVAEPDLVLEAERLAGLGA